MSLRQIQFKVRGQVQGVNFRAWTKDRATVLGVTGWVSNSSDGHVVGEARGEHASIEQFIKQLGEGPRIAQVSGVDVEKDVEVDKADDGSWVLTKFEVRR